MEHFSEPTVTKRLHTVEIEGFGPVTFERQGKLAMKRISEAARRGGIRGYGSDEMALRGMPAEKAQRLREDSLLISRAVTEPAFADDAELVRAFERREALMLIIAAAIRERSWPNK